MRGLKAGKGEGSGRCRRFQNVYSKVIIYFTCNLGNIYIDRNEKRYNGMST